MKKYDSRSLLRFTLMGSLAVQYGLQTKLQQSFQSKDVDKLSVVFACEVVKLVLSAFILGFISMQKGKSENTESSMLRNIALSAIPALIYTVQNLCVQTAYSELNAITFNCLNQTKLITTAICLFLMKGVKQNQRQIMALALVSSAGMLLSMKDDAAMNGKGNSSLGILMILLAAVLSGIAATLTQIFMQELKLNPFVLTICMCIVSLVAVASSAMSQKAMTGYHIEKSFDNWTVYTILPVTTQAIGGMLVGLVTNYCGSLDKGVSFICGLALSAVAECVLGGAMLSTKAIVALVLVASGSWMHTKESVLRKQKEALKKKTS